ncbi:MAG: hypothetical protein M5U29_00870 [Anaerolineae bacterium]|nr:hypothetical protein [Anaerolineae bacterium]
MSEERLVALIRTHLARYPQMQIADIYKLLHQAAFGPGHLVASKKAAREWLEHEAGRISPSAEEALLESAHPDAQIVRLHLRPYLAAGGGLKPLLEAFVRSAEQVRGDARQMAAWWQVFESLCAGGALCADMCQQREAALFGRARAQEEVAGGAPFSRILCRLPARLPRAHGDRGRGALPQAGSSAGRGVRITQAACPCALLAVRGAAR